MGATIPIAMFAIRRTWSDKSERSFSFLYLANVIGAVLGACTAPAFIELYGFHSTLRKGAQHAGPARRSFNEYNRLRTMFPRRMNVWADAHRSESTEALAQ